MKTAAKLFMIAMMLVSGASNAQEIARAISKKYETTKAPKTTYYYLPDAQSYYDVSNKKYIYTKDGKWVTSSALPANYRNFNFKTSRKVLLTEKSAPYRNFETHKKQYKKTYVKRTAAKRRPGNSANAPGHLKMKHKVKHAKK